jgi:hypothetical protein
VEKRIQNLAVELMRLYRHVLTYYMNACIRPGTGISRTEKGYIDTRQHQAIAWDSI